MRRKRTKKINKTKYGLPNIFNEKNLFIVTAFITFISEPKIQVSPSCHAKMFCILLYDISIYN